MRRTLELGFTLIELMITVAIVGLLASLAIPSYYRMIAAAHRAEANVLLADLYGMEAAFFAEMQRYGCLDEVGFQIEGNGHFAIWICDDGSGCVLEPGGGIQCPCLEAPDDWTGPGGDPFVRRDPTDPGVRYAWVPIPRGAAGRGFLASGPPVMTTMAVPVLPILTLPLLPVWGGPPTPPPSGSAPAPIIPSDPGGLPVPLDLPDTCAALMASAIFTAGADNWCARAVPEVVDVFWILSNEGKRVNTESYPEVSGNTSVCSSEGAPP